MPRIAAFIIVIAALFLSSSLSGGTVGVSSVCKNSQCIVVASSSITSLILGACLTIFIILFPRKETQIDSTLIVGIWRRFGAFVLDFILVLLVITPVAAVPILIAEASYIGEFRWAFEREFIRPTDNKFILPGVFVAFIAVYLYFFLLTRTHNQTIGQYILNYKIRVLNEAEGVPRYAKRTMFSFIGLCMWPISVILALTKSNKAFWWDTMTNTEVVRTIAVNNAPNSDARYRSRRLA